MSRYYIFQNGLVVLKNGGRTLPDTKIDSDFSRLFTRSGLVDRGNNEGDVWAELATDVALPKGYTLHERRGLWLVFDEAEFFRVGKAFHICEWQRTNKFCGACGSPAYLDEREWGMRCSVCSEIVFPIIAPAVIVAVERGDKLLMGHGINFPPGRFSVLAGFVEPGENLEETVIREIYEESRIRVKNIRYFGSQPWPFPRSLMIGFNAEWESGEIEVDNTEILEARWFSPDELPDSPVGVSISRRLIDDFARRCSKQNQTSTK